MRLRPLAFVPLLAASFSLAALHCGGATNGEFPDGGTPGSEAGPSGEGGGPLPSIDAGVHPNADAVGATTASKVDVLFVVDNSASMADKAKLLATSAGALLRRVVVTGDVHVGVITSSLGSMGGDVCPNSGATNMLAHLSKTGPGNVPVAGAAKGFLAYGSGSADVEALVADTEQLVRGVGEAGCGLEAQLESAYRFLVQPDPWASIAIDNTNRAQYIGVDADVLAQRKAFLRPDSLVVVVLLTDEDDSSADPRSIGGQGWGFEASQFPGSPVFRTDGKTTTAPRGTSACASDPGSPDCTSCGFAATCDPSDAACQKIKTDPECQKNGGYYGANEDQLGVRFQHMKQRYGIDPQFPLSRYVDGFTKQNAPNRDGEHVVQGNTVSPYLADAKCTNPIFAASLPSSTGDELCNLPRGPRGKELVVFAVIGGVPAAAAGAAPDWLKILGANPDAYDYTGVDPHMIQSTTPRGGLPAPTSTRGDNGTDPVSGREWVTGGNDLQYACTFTLPTPRTCAAADVGCDCNSADTNPPLCSSTLGEQLKGKAYPTVRELRVARALGERGVIGSICPTSPADGYTETMTRLADRIAPRLVK